jgi:hypothetical protein
MTESESDAIRREVEQAVANDRKRMPPNTDAPIEEPPPPGPHVEPDVAEVPGPGIRPPV